MDEKLIAKARELRAIIEKAMTVASGLTDAEVVTATCLHPKWSGNGVKYIAGQRVQYNDELYKVKAGMGHTSQADWSPDMAVSLFEKINEANAGTIDDPIPYSGNMALENGKYYIEYGIVYRCTRDTGIAVYNKLSELVGIYVEVAK